MSRIRMAALTFEFNDGKPERCIVVSNRRARVIIPRQYLIDLANLATDVFEEGEQR